MKGALFAISLSLASIAHAQSDGEYVLMAGHDEIEAMCNAIYLTDARCSFNVADPADHQFLADDTSFTEVSKGDQGLLGGLTNTRHNYHSALIVMQNPFGEGGGYFTAHTLVYRQSIFGSSKTNDLDNRIWSAVSARVRVVPIDSDAAQSYIFEQHEAAAKAYARSQAIQQYQQSPQYKVDLAAARILSCARTQKGARNMIDNEKRIEKLTGVVDLSVLHSAGSVITQCDDQMSRDWSEYKAFGGTANSLNDLLATRMQN